MFCAYKGFSGAGVIVGIGAGLLLRLAELSAEQIDLLGFAGELMLRLLKMLVLPLVAGSMVAGMSHDQAEPVQIIDAHVLSVSRHTIQH